MDNIFILYALNTQESFIRLDNLDSCVVGLNHLNKLVYSYTKLIEYFTEEFNDETEALAHISHNIASIEDENSFQILYDLK